MARSAAISGKMTNTWVSRLLEHPQRARIEPRAAVDEDVVEARAQDGQRALQLVDGNAEVGVRVGRSGQHLIPDECGVR